MNLSYIKAKAVPILKNYRVRKAGVFGSAARGEMKRGSDIDFLVYLNKNISLLGMASLKVDLEEALKKKVDLVEYCSIKPSMREKILKEEVGLL
jgi:uncharacterized protein